MPRNTTILLIRHAEKPASGPKLSAGGEARAQAYSVFFQGYPVDGAPVRPRFLFAAADSDASHRPRLTVEPLASALRLEINDKHADKDYAEVARHLLDHPKYDDATVLVCWHHGEILQLAQALGADAGVLPPAAGWPPHWPGEVFGWVLQLRYDGAGRLVPGQTRCTSQRLMYDDCGQEPPLTGAPTA
ncbi:MAG TPA: hypothetical protein VHG91_12065 [Longimicrobium sp.]|nr:hypothetical protein [Longimicrobium sp.]